ncbi:MAG: CarD family transcriptional regulator [Clostridia bacterium]|nr:CarD family transcriptional regulator [Clostridia bacterium]
MFQKNDIITYGTAGVCKIAGIIEKSFAGVSRSYYELIPVNSKNSTVFVPADNPALTEKMHPILSEEDICALLHSALSQELVWIPDESARKQYYKEILDRGDRLALLGAIRVLHQYHKDCQAQGKKVHVCDERFFKDAQRILYDEFSYVLHLDRDQFLTYILSPSEGNEKNHP